MPVQLSMMLPFTKYPMVSDMPRSRLALLAASSLMALALTGCSKVYVPSFIQVYQPDIEQGNVLQPNQVEKIHVGMSRMEVHQILGTPALNNIFHEGKQEIYVFYDKPGKKDVYQHNLILDYGADGTLAKIEHSGDPLDNAPAKDMPYSVTHKKKGSDGSTDTTKKESDSDKRIKLTPPTVTGPGETP